MLDMVFILKFLAVYLFLAGFVVALLTLAALKKPNSVMVINPPEELVSDVRLLLEEIRFELTVPDVYKALLYKPIVPQIDRLNLLATHLRKYVERHVFDYMTRCSYVSRTLWLRKSRVTAEVDNDQIILTVYGVGGIIIHSIHFMPTDYAHETEYFKNKVY